MSRIAYFIDTSRGSQFDMCGFFKALFLKHKQVFSISKGVSPKILDFFESTGIRIIDFKEGLKANIFDINQEDIYDLLHVAQEFPDGVEEVEIFQKEDAGQIYSSPYDIVLCRPVFRTPGDEWSTAITVAHLQSYGFKVFDEYFSEITHATIAPHEDIQIVGKGDVEYYPDSIRGESHHSTGSHRMIYTRPPLRRLEPPQVRNVEVGYFTRLLFPRPWENPKVRLTDPLRMARLQNPSRPRKLTKKTSNSIY